MKPSYVTPAEAARLAGVSRQTIYNRIRDGRLEVHRHGPRLLFIKRDDVTDLQTQLDGLFEHLLVDNGDPALIYIKQALNVINDHNAVLYYLSLAACDLDLAEYPAVYDILNDLQLKSV